MSEPSKAAMDAIHELYGWHPDDGKYTDRSLGLCQKGAAIIDKHWRPQQEKFVESVALVSAKLTERDHENAKLRAEAIQNRAHLVRRGLENTKLEAENARLREHIKWRMRLDAGIEEETASAVLNWIIGSSALLEEK